MVGEERTSAQDLEFGLRQLVEIALRALSAAINDPFTAIAVVDRLGAALEEIFGRSLQPPVWCDKAGEARVIAQRSDAQGLTDAAFDAIRQAASGIPAVLIRMADVLGQLAPSLGSVDMREAVERQLGRLAETAKEALSLRPATGRPSWSASSRPETPSPPAARREPSMVFDTWTGSVRVLAAGTLASVALVVFFGSPASARSAG